MIAGATRCPTSRRTAARTGPGPSCSAPSAGPSPPPRSGPVPCTKRTPGASPRTPALAGRQGSAVGGVGPGQTSAGATGGIAPFDRGDRRSLPLGVLSQGRVKGPLRRPRRLGAVPPYDARPPARTTCRPQRRACVAIALDPPPTPVADAIPLGSQPSRHHRCPRFAAQPTMPPTLRPNRQPSSMRGPPVQARNLIGNATPVLSNDP